jgi:heme-degrading monooxygenase HmoA
MRILSFALANSGRLDMVTIRKVMQGAIPGTAVRGRICGGKLLRLAVAGLWAALLLACSTQEHGTITIANERADSLKPRDLANFGIAFVTPSTVTGQEQDRPALSLIFAQILEELRPGTHVVPLTETLSNVNRAGIAEDYKRMMANYHGAELLDSVSLAQVSKATGVRYIAQLKMATFQQESQDRFGVFGLRLVETKKANIRLSLQIWNSEDGSVAWEGTQELYQAHETMKENPIAFRTIVEAAARSLIARIP